MAPKPKRPVLYEESRLEKGSLQHMNEGGIVSKETVVLRRWGSNGFINGVDNVNWPPYRDSKS